MSLHHFFVQKSQEAHSQAKVLSIISGNLSLFKLEDYCSESTPTN